MLIPYSTCLNYTRQHYSYVIHIGAHLGEEYEAYKEAGVQKTFWFEANPKIYEQLVANFANQTIDNFFCQALYNVDDKEVEFKITNNGQSSSILELGTHKQHYPNITVTDTIKVKTKIFDTFVKENQNQFNLNQFKTFVNLDVQGVEHEVLLGFGDLLKENNPLFNIDAIYTEVNFEEVYKDAKTIAFINVLLGSYGFEKIISSPTHYGWGDALYIRKRK